MSQWHIKTTTTDGHPKDLAGDWGTTTDGILKVYSLKSNHYSTNHPMEEITNWTNVDINSGTCQRGKAYFVLLKI